MFKKTILIFLGLMSVSLFAGESNSNNQTDQQYNSYFDLEQSNSSTRAGIGQFGFPSNPMNDRARGYLLKGKAQAAITNYGRIIDWDHHPPGRVPGCGAAW